MIMQPKIGDKLKVIGASGVYHYGVYVGPRGFDKRDVVHNAKNGGVELVRLQDFASRNPVMIVDPVERSWQEQRQIAARAMSLLGRKYDLINFNCEHLANYATTGKAVSPALQVAAVIGVIGFLFWAGSRA
jgi:lecithin:retinol acyltransferase